MTKIRLFTVVIFFFRIIGTYAQDFMIQGWYWDYPKTASGANWADTLRLKAPELGEAGFTSIWLPPLSRTASGNWSNGYDPKDLYDYGEYGQGATGFGTRTKVNQMIYALNANGISPVADLVFNHRSGGSAEDNPGLKNYVVNFYTWDKANSGANPFPYDRMQVVLPLGGASGNGAGNYYFKLKSRSGHSRFYNWEYKVYFQTSRVGWQNLPAVTETEPNGGGNCGQPYNQIYLGRDVNAWVDSGGCGIDEFYLNIGPNDFYASGDALFIYFGPRNSGNSDVYISGIWSGPRNTDIVNDLYYQTYTNFSNMPSGQGSMNWNNFKPNLSRETWLSGDWDAMMFYYDYDQFQTDTRNKLFDWTRWNWSNVEMKGMRLDAVKHFSPEFTGDMLDNLYDNGMAPPMVVGEWYSTNTDELAGWVNSVYSYMDNDTKAAIAPRVFDFSLREALRQACDQTGYDVRNVFSASPVDQGKLNGNNVVTFANNHDFRYQTGFASLIKNNRILAYAYLLTNNQLGIPCIYYPDYYGYPANGPDYHPADKASLKNEINQLMDIHRDYITGSGSRTYLNKAGSGFSNNAGSSNAGLLVYQLKGSGEFKDIVVAINFNGNQMQFSQQLDGLPVGTRLSELTGNSMYSTALVESSNIGIPNSMWIDLPAHGYAVWRVGVWGLWEAERSYVSFQMNNTQNDFTVWNNGTGNIQYADLGTFTEDDTLLLTGYDIKTWKGSGGEISGGQFHYTIYPLGDRPADPVFLSYEITWIEDLTGFNPGDQRWGLLTPGINLLEGLQPGEYTLEFYTEINGINPAKTEYDNNTGNPENYTAHFSYNYVPSIAPGHWNDPATWKNGVVPEGEHVVVEIRHEIILNSNQKVKDLHISEGSLLITSSGSLTVNGETILSAPSRLK